MLYTSLDFFNSIMVTKFFKFLVQCGLWHDECYKQAHYAGIDLIPDRLVKF